MPFSGTDETLNCKDCRNEFIFTIGEQEFYDKMNFADPPKRCKACRELKKAKNGQTAGYNSSGGYTSETRSAPVVPANDFPADRSDKGGRGRGGRRGRNDWDE